MLLIGDEIIKTLKGTKSETGAFIDYCEQNGIEIIPTLAANASPSGRVATDAFEEFIEIIQTGGGGG